MNWMTLPVKKSVCPPIPELYARILSNLACLGFGVVEQQYMCQDQTFHAKTQSDPERRKEYEF